MSGDREHGLPVAFCIVKAIEEVDATGPRSCNANPQFTGKFRVTTGSEGGGLFVPNLDESYFFLIGPQGFEDAIHTIAGYTEYGVDAPCDQSLYEQFGYRLGHFSPGARIVRRPVANTLAVFTTANAKSLRLKNIDPAGRADVCNVQLKDSATGPRGK
jgi:hypothetical protein